MGNIDILYDRYKSRSLEEIISYLKHIKIVKMEDDEYFPLDNDTMSNIIKKPRNVSFTFNSEITTDKGNLILSVFKTIPFLVKSSSRFFLKPDIGEVFDQISDEDINQISAIYVDSENFKVVNSEGDHFLMEAVLLVNIKKVRKDKLKKINE